MNPVTINSVKEGGVGALGEDPDGGAGVGALDDEEGEAIAEIRVTSRCWSRESTTNRICLFNNQPQENADESNFTTGPCLELRY